MIWLTKKENYNIKNNKLLYIITKILSMKNKMIIKGIYELNLYMNMNLMIIF